MTRFNELVNVIRDIDSSSLPKKKNLDNLRDILNDDDLINVLNKNSEANRHDVLDWDSVFNTLHQTLLKIEDCRRRKDTTPLCNLSLQFASCVVNTVKKACHNHPLIKTTSFIRSFREAMSMSNLRQNLAYVYVEILKFILVTHRKYRSEVSHEQWQGLLQSSIGLFESSQTLQRVEQSLIVEILNIILMNGTCQSDLSLYAKPLFPLVRSALLDDTFCRSKMLFQERIIQLSVTLCGQTAKECRSEICQFGEDVICPLIGLYDNIMSPKGKSLVFDLVLLQVHAHHPKSSAASAYAFDSHKWNACLRSAWNLLQEELDRPFDRKNRRPPHFTDLAVEVFKLVFENSSAIFNGNDDGSPASKRKKVNLGVMTIIDSSQLFAEAPWSWSRISVISGLLAKYPSCLQEEDLIPLLDRLTELQSSCKNDVLLEHICLCCISLLKAEKYIMHVKKNAASVTWDKMWETTVRIVGSSRVEEHSHLLLQALIFHGKAKQLSELTNMFTSLTLRMTSASVRTLNVLLAKYDLSSLNLNLPSAPDHKALRSSLLGWLFPPQSCEGLKGVEPSAIAELLIKLSAKTVQRHWACEQSLKERNPFDEMLKEMDDVYAMSSFDVSWNEEKVSGGEAETVASVDARVWHTMEEILVKKCEEWAQQGMHEDENLNLYAAFHHLSLLIEIWAAGHGVCPRNPLFLDTMERLIQFLSNQIEYYLNTPESYPEALLNIVGNFRRLLLKKFPARIKQWLFATLDTLMAQPLLMWVTEEQWAVDTKSDIEMDLHSEHYDGEYYMPDLDECFKMDVDGFLQVHSVISSEKEKFRYECFKLLGSFLTLGEEEKYSDRVTEITYKFLSSSTLDMKSFNAVAWFMQCLIRKSSLSQCAIGSIIVTVKTLFCKAGFDCHTTLVILSLLQGIIPHIHRRGSEKEKHNFLSLISGFLTGINKKKFGLRVTTRLMQCIKDIAKVDPSASWSNIQGAPAVEILLQFVDSPSHEVRLAAILCLRTVFFQSFGHLDPSWHLKLFSVMIEKVNMSFIIEGDVHPGTAVDEAANRTATALLAFVMILISCPPLFKNALFEMLRFSSCKHLDVGLFRKVLLHVCALKEVSEPLLVARNLGHLVEEWLRKNHPLQDLVKYLCRCSLPEFYSKYMETLVPILFASGKKSVLLEMSQLMKKTIVEMYEECFPHIMSHLLPGLEENEINALRYHKQLEEVLSEEGVVMLLSSNLPKVIVGIIKKMYDPQYFSEITGITGLLSPKDSSSITFKKFGDCMKYLQMSSPSPDISLLEFLCDKMPSHIQIILLDLAVNFSEAVFLQDKLVSFSQYCVFTSSLSADIKDNKFSALTTHIVCSVVHRIAFVIEENLQVEPKLSLAACHFLKYYLSVCLHHSSDILCTLLNFILNALCSAVRCKGKLGCAAVSVLKFIFFEEREVFVKAFFLVNPFPEESDFKEFQNVIEQVKSTRQLTLEEEISNFLLMHRQMRNECIESLKHLHRKLSECQDELKIIFENLCSTSVYSEETSESLLHRLIIVLIDFATSTVPEIRHEAGRCLGEIGPTDLGTLVLRSEFGLPIASVSEIAPLIGECLLNKNMKVVKAASDAMYSLLKFKDCFKFAGLVLSNTVKHKLLSLYAFSLTISHPQTLCCKTFHHLDFNLEPEDADLVRTEVMSCGISCSDMLYPFSVGKKIQGLTFLIDKEVSQSQLNNVDLWCFSEGRSHAKWIVRLTCTVLLFLSKGNNFLTALITLCKENAAFSERVLPLFVSKLALAPEFFSLIKYHIKIFFEYHVKFLHNQSEAPSDTVCLNKTSVRCLLNLVHYLRICGGEGEVVSNTSKLDLNYLHIAQAAQFCNADISSIMYIELWSDGILRMSDEEPVYGQSRTPLELICEKKPEEGSVAQKILWDAYRKICNTDAIYGCGSSLLLDPSKRPLHYELQGEWDKVILSHDLQLSLGNTEATEGLIFALYKAGFQHVLDVYLSASGTQSPNIQYECAWRLSKWDTHISATQPCVDNFQKHHFMALRALSNFDEVGLTESINQARSCVSESLVNLCLESCKSIYRPLSLFRQIQEIDEFQSNCNSSQQDGIFAKWTVRDQMCVSQFDDIEPILWQRIVMLKCSERECWKQAAEQVAVRLAGLAREEGQYQVAAKCIGSFTNVPLSSSVGILLKIEEACLAWDTGDLPLGKNIMRGLLNSLVTPSLTSESTTIYAKALKLYGDWMVETKSENPRDVIESYYLKALQLLRDAGETDSDSVLDIYSALACFADGQYQNLSTYCKSRAFEIKKEWIKRAIEDVENIKKQPNLTKDDERSIVLKQKQSKIDNEEIYNTEREKNKYLSDAILYYLKCLHFGDRNNLGVFRVASLWLENMLDPEVNTILESNLSHVPSYKFVPILPQMVPRMSNVKDNFTIKLNKLLVQCAEEHPHHTLPVILALANSQKDLDFCSGATCSQNKKPEPRVLGAQCLVNKLSKNQSIGDLLHKMNLVSYALVSLAYLEVGKQKGDVKIPESEAIRKLHKVESVLVPTLTIPVEKSCKYDTIIGIRRYDSSYSLVGGINAPKKIICVGTDGIKRLQLVKGKDDLRQDAVMQQVFTILNSLLRSNKHTSKRKLLIRTYKVVPLSQRSGVIEWCENTEPLLTYLTGSNHQSGAHKKYYPDDTPAHKCREMMMKVWRKSNDERLPEYKKICSLIHPVFRYFFLEHFTSSGMWFERRLAYTHSVAASSMIGYILGLGDRHLMNILVDKKSAEVIHIDFGIAFEMGLVLPTPETVPFRLTRDIVDGMGVSGVEGVFRKSCEKTMSVLREHQNILLTVLEVLLYDPLYAWTITPSKAYKLQRKSVNIEEERDSVEVNRMAERALQRLKQKLVGTEAGAGVSVSAQVNRLVQEASDPSNLSRLYFGWEPYL